LFWRRKRKEGDKEKKLPPRQHEIKSIMRWGIDHPGITSKLPHISKEDWSLEVDGEVDNPVVLSWDDFLDLPQTTSVSDFHCVETWSVLDQKWEGAIFKDLMNLVKPRDTMRYVWFECGDGYTTDLPLEELTGDDIILAHRLNDEPLSQPLGGPMRLVVPHKYAYKSAMWLTHIMFLKDKRLGYWEKGGYSDTADVWKNDRFR
jgi:DMSO/TMAO reductase YedYZ molybdopterin-dependent catalytic subunit